MNKPYFVFNSAKRCLRSVELQVDLTSFTGLYAAQAV